MKRKPCDWRGRRPALRQGAGRARMISAITVFCYNPDLRTYGKKCILLSPKCKKTCKGYCREK